jgi:DNA-binding response OmpR family regulator
MSEDSSPGAKVMTGSGDEYSLVSGLGAGANEFLAKPVRLDELVARIQATRRNAEEETG